MTRRPGVLLVIALVLAAPSAPTAASLTTEVDGVRVELTSQPEQPGTRQPTTYILRLVAADGAPVRGAKVTLHGRMADGMTVLAPFQAEHSPGTYRARVLFTMEGPWQLRLRVAGAGPPFELPLTEHVGR